MYGKRTVYLAMALLLVLSVAVLTMRARIPMGFRALTASVNLMAIAALWLVSRQTHFGKK